jgi:hypothetical protein
MAYQVDRFNGTFLTSVEDGTIDTTTDIRFVGKNYAGYGEVQNENFLHMLEHFANTTAPPKAVPGQVWFDSGNKRLKFYDGTKWKVANGSETGADAPVGLDVGEFWWDTAAKQLYTWSGTEFILVGPEASPDLGASTVTAQVVKDTTNTSHTILKMQAGGKVVAIVSQDEFTLNATLNPIDDFTFIKKGFTLAKTNSSGVSTDFVYWGNASNSLLFNGFGTDDFYKKGDDFGAEEIAFQDAGFTLGNASDFRLRVEDDDQVYFENRLGNPLHFRITVSPSDIRTPVSVKATGLIPGTDDVFDLGSVDAGWKNIYATSVIANVTGDVTGNTTGSHKGNLLANDTSVMIDAANKIIGYSGADLRGTLTGSVIGNVTGTASSADTLSSIAPSQGIPTVADKTSIPVRDSTGAITASSFIGVADKTDRMKIDNSAVDSDPNYKSAKTTATANTIAARDGSGNLVAVIFQGTATSARYADLAEKYSTDKEYEPGTVVSVCEHDGHDVEACKAGDRALGVVSTDPAYMMNSEAEGQYIALKGRVPCKVGGKVVKGQRLVAGGNGYAVVGSGENVFGIALESSDQEGIKLIEVAVL